MNQNELVIDITHAFIAQAAPDELPLFPGLSQIYRKNPENIIRPESGKDQMLGCKFANYDGEILIIMLLSKLAS